MFKMTPSRTFTPLTDCTFPHVSCVSEDNSVDSRTYFTLQDVFNASLKPTSYSLKWISGQSRTLAGQDVALPSGCTEELLCILRHYSLILIETLMLLI